MDVLRNFEVSEHKLCQAFLNFVWPSLNQRERTIFPFISEDVKERTVSFQGCELVQLSTFEGHDVFFCEGHPLSVFFHSLKPFDLNLLNFK